MIYDKNIREPLFFFLEEQYGRCRILEEKNAGRSRADVVLVAGQDLIGIEIKSDADTYTRLAGQVKDYDRFFDRNIVVVGTRHAMHIEEHVPEHWGIITVEEADNGEAGGREAAGSLDFYFLRRPKPNPQVRWEKKLSLLWRPELAQLQELHQMPKYKDRSKDFVIEKITAGIPDKIEEETLKKEICEILMERDYTTVAETLAEYRKSETQKKLDAETDPLRRLQIMMEKPVVGKRKAGKSTARKQRIKKRSSGML